MKPATAPYPSLGRAYTVIAILWIVTVFSQLDRQLPALLVSPLKAALALSDTQFSLVQGYAFALAYTLMGLPLGRMVDHRNRRNLIIVGLGFWSVMTIASGFARDFGEIALARIGVGIGEAVLAPAAFSIIADYVAADRRGRALGVYYLSLSVGAGASMLIGGLVIRALPEAGIALPYIGHIDPWQAVFVIAGLPGIPLMALMLLVAEPVRRDIAARQKRSFGEFLLYVRRHFAAIGRIIAITALMAVIGYGAVAWAPAHLERSYGMQPAQSGPLLGVAIAVAGITSSLVSGWLSDRWTAAGLPAARLRVTLLSTLLLLPCAILWPLMPNAMLSILFFGLTLFANTLSQAAIPVAMQEIVPNDMRGQAVALYLLFAGLVGIGFGPTSVALVTDYVLHDEQALRWAISLVALPSSLIALWASWTGQVPFARSRTALLASTQSPIPRHWDSRSQQPEPAIQNGVVS